MVKTNFGNAISRLLWGGVCLSRVESGLLQRMVDELPGKLRAVVEAQFETYNLVQREADGRALNFYRRRWGRADVSNVPLLAMRGMDAPLIRVSFTIDENGPEHRAVLTTMNRWAFCLTFDADMRALCGSPDFSVMHVTRSWRSNFEPG